jgi:hypothetical protein
LLLVFTNTKSNKTIAKQFTSSIENRKSKNISSLTGFCAMPPCHNWGVQAWSMDLRIVNRRCHKPRNVVLQTATNSCHLDMFRAALRTADLGTSAVIQKAA